MEDRVFIFDTTLRDGEQSPGCSMNFEEKIRMARQIQLLCVDVSKQDSLFHLLATSSR
jgi:Isopropylmalate/homocitrate/citramalate synthases